MRVTQRLPSDRIAQFALKSASMLMRSDEGKKAGYWRKPLLGKPRVEGSAYLIGTYTYFILGCPLAGVSSEPFFDEGTVPFLADAEWLFAYYLEYPEVKAILDAHFKQTDEFAARTLSPEVRNMIGPGMRERMTKSSPGRRSDEALLTIFWGISRQRQFSIQEGIQGLYTAFLYGASMRPNEVQRLWGIQAATTHVPFMDRPLAAARQETLADIDELLGKKRRRRIEASPYVTLPPTRASASTLLLHPLLQPPQALPQYGRNDSSHSRYTVPSGRASRL